MNKYSRTFDYVKTKDTKKRDAIFRATLKLINEGGFQATPMSKIAREAGVAAGTIYLYFKSKEDLINQLYINANQQLLESTINGYSEQMPVLMAIQRVWMNYLNALMTHPEAFAFVKQCAHASYLNPDSKEAEKRLMLPLYHLIERGKNEDLIKPLSSEMILILITSPLEYLANVYLHQQAEPDEDDIDLLFQACWDSIKA